MDCQSIDSNTQQLQKKLDMARENFSAGREALNQLFNSLRSKTPTHSTVATDAWDFIPSTNPKDSFPWTAYSRHQKQVLPIKDTLNDLCDDTFLRNSLKNQQNCADKLSKSVEAYTTRSTEINHWISLFQLLEKSLLTGHSPHEQNVCTPLLHPPRERHLIDCCVIS